jgi:hypothetical protein
MTFLKNRRAWSKWKKETFACQEGIKEPLEYPCYGYATLLSFGYEELQENYLHYNDLYRMINQLMSKSVKK